MMQSWKARLSSRMHGTRRGIAALWLIVALPVLLMALCLAVEAARLWLMRQQLTVSLESAAMSAVKQCDNDAGLADSLSGRTTALDLASVNTVDGNPVGLDTNYSSTARNGNASCGGEIVYGALLERTNGRVLNADLPFGCGDETTGPKAVTLRRISSGDWQTVKICDRNYNCMVVVGTPNYTIANSPSVVRIQNVTADSFDFFVQNVNTQNPVAGIPVNFLVVEEGQYTQAVDGVTMEAVKYTSTVTDRRNSFNAEPRAYLNAYTTPVVVGQVMSFNDPRWSVFWSRGQTRGTPANAADLRVGKSVAEDPVTTRADETVGYIVIEQGSGDMRGLPYYAAQEPRFVAGIGGAPPYTIGLPGAPTAPGGYAVASQSGEVGGNGSWALLWGDDPVSDAGLNLALDEDQLGDNERNHVTEVVNHISLAGPCAVRVRHQMDVNYMCTFGCSLTPPTLQSEVFAWFDCAMHRPRLTKIDQFICSEGVSAVFEGEGPDVSATVGAATADGWLLWSNGEICFNLDIPVNGQYTFCARLWQDAGGGAPANAEFRVDGVAVNDFDVTPTSFATAQTYCVTVNLAPGNHKFAVAFTNDFYAPPIDRNLHIDFMSVTGP